MGKHDGAGPGRPDGAPAQHYTFVQPSPGRRVLQILVLFDALGLIYAAYQLITVGGEQWLTMTIVAAVLLVGGWTVLQSWIPQRIDIDKSVITINRNGETRRYDLTDPGVELRVRDGAIAFAHYMEPFVVVRARDVKWQLFLDVLMHYQDRADINAELRDQRFSA